MKHFHIKKGLKKISITLLAIILAIAVPLNSFGNKIEAVSNPKRGIMLGKIGLDIIESPAVPSAATGDWKGSHLYWGARDDIPLKWQILAPSGANFHDEGSTADTMLLLLDYDGSEWGTSYFDDVNSYVFNSNDSNIYVGSELELYINKLAETYLSDMEKWNTNGNNSPDDGKEFGDHDRWFIDQAFTEPFLWFIPSGTMMMNENYGFFNDYVDCSQRILGGFWLSAKRQNSSDTAVIVGQEGDFQEYKASNEYNILPATAISNDGSTDNDSRHGAITLVSVSGKKAGNGVSSQLTNVEAVNEEYSDYKLTLRDVGHVDENGNLYGDEQKITISDVKRPSQTNVDFSFTKQGDGTSVSAVITDKNDNVLQYGRIKIVNTGNDSGTASVTLPDNFDTDGYKLKIFTELYKGEKMTDYSSELVDVSVPLANVTGTFKYKDADGNEKTETKSIQYGSNISSMTDFPAYSIPSGYRLTDSENPWILETSGIDLSNVTGDFTISVGYTKIWDVTMSYRDADHNVQTSTITVDDGTDFTSKLIDVGNISYADKAGVRYRLKNSGSGAALWTVKDGGNISNVTKSFQIEAETVKQYKATVCYRDASNSANYISKDYWVDEGGSLTEHLPTLPVQIKGYRLKDSSSLEKIWSLTGSSSSLTSIWEPLTAEPEYVQNWEVQFKNWDDSNLQSLLYIDNGSVLRSDQIPANPSRPLYTFTAWDRNLSDPITADTVIKPQFSSKTFVLKANKGLDILSKETAKSLFGSLDNSGINQKLSEIYSATLTLDGTVYDDQNGLKYSMANESDYAHIKAGDKGVYTVNLTYTNPSDASFNASATMKLRISDQMIEGANGGKLTANDFSMSVEEVKTLSETFYPTLAGAKAYDKNGNECLTQLSDKSQLKAAQGIYPVSFKANLDGEEVSITVQVTVQQYTNDKTVSEGILERISANDIFLKSSDVASVKTDTDRLIQMAHAQAFNTVTGESLPVTVLDNSNISDERGSYPIVFKTANGASVTVQVYVSDHMVESTETDGYRIRANHFELSAEEVKSADDQKLITLANALAVKKDTGEIGEIGVDKTALKAEKGVYQIVFSAPDGTNLSVEARVNDYSTESGYERMTANDFIISIADVQNPNLDSFKNAANVKAVHTVTGASIDITGFDTSRLVEAVGIYPVTFQTAAGTQITVNASVTDVMKEENGLQISANSFAVSSEKVASLNENRVIQFSHAQAIVKQTGQKLSIAVDGITDIGTEKGSYPVTLSASYGGYTIKTDIYVSVRDNEAENEYVNERISGNHIEMTKDEVKTLSDKDIITRGNVKAVDTQSGAELDVSIKNRDAIKQEKGLYDIIFTAPKNTELTLHVKVIDNLGISGTTCISANDIHMGFKDFKEDSDAMDAFLTDAGSVHAYQSETGKKIAVKVKDKSALKKQVGTYLITFASDEANPTEVSVRVYVDENSHVDETTHERITANDIYVASSDVKSLDKDNLIHIAGAKAENMETGENVSIISASHTALEKKGIYTATFTTGKGTKLSVKVYVAENGSLNQENQENISANHFKLTKAQMQEADNNGTLDQLLKEKAQVRAVDITNGNLLSVTVDYSKLQCKKGIYDVSFSTAKKTETTVKVTIVDESSGNTDSSIHEAIYANHFSLSVEEANSIDNEKLIKWANAYAEDTQTGNPINVIVKASNIQPQVGIYDVTFETAQHTEVTVQVTVKTNGTSSVENKERISANDFYLSVDEVQSLSDSLLIKRSLAEARDENGYEIDIQVEHDIRDEIGSYDVIFKTQKGTSVSVTAYVSDNTSENADNKEIITANHFYISIDDVKANNDQLLISAANAKAFHSETGVPVLVKVSDKTQLEALKGIYPIQFSTAKETKITVNAIVMDKGVIADESDIFEAIYANDFTLKSSEVNTLDNAKVIDLADAIAINTADGRQIAITKVDFSQIKAVNGNYDVTFETEKGTKMTVQATVKQNIVINDEKKEVMYSNDFHLSVEDVEALLNDSSIGEKLITYAQARACDKDTGETIEVSMKEHNLEAKQGVYTVTFQTKTGNTEIDSHITVTAKGNTDSDKDERITANDFAIGIQEVKDGLSDNQIISLARAEAMNITTGDLLSMSVESHIKPQKGIYDVKFTTDAGTNISVLATVLDKSAEGNTDTDKKDLLYANDFVISQEEAKDITEAEILSLSHARAYDKESGAPVSVSVENVDAIQNKSQGLYNLVLQSEHGTRLTIQVTINAQTSENPDKDIHERMSANDFSVKASDVKKLAAKDIIALANAKAIDTETGEELHINVLSTLQASKGSYDVTFTTDRGTSTTVKGYVLEEGTSGNQDDEIIHAIYANHFSLSVAEASQVTADQLISLSGVKAYDKKSGAPVNVSVDVQQVKGKPQGYYPVEFKTDYTAMTVYATVTADGTSGQDPDTGDAIHLTANHFSVTQEQVKTLTDDDIIRLANATAIHTTTGRNIDILVESHLEAKKGIYDVIFTVKDLPSVSITVRGTVTEKESDGNNDEKVVHSLYANDFSLSVEEAAHVTAKQLISLSKAEAYEKVSGAPVAIQVDVSQIQGKPQGRYAVEFKTEKTNIIVNATITAMGESSNDPETGDCIHITANHFVISMDQVEKLTDKEIIGLADASAYNEATGEDVGLQVQSNIKGQPGVYDVTFTAKGTSVSLQVKATVVKNGQMNPDAEHKEIIYANDIVIDSTQAKNITDEDILTLSKAGAYDFVTGLPVPVHVIKNDIRTQSGIYQVTLGTQYTKMLISVTVTERSGENPNPAIKESLYANDFSIGENDAIKVSDEMLKKLANVKALNEAGDEIEVAVKENTIRGKKAGIYDLTFVTENKTSLSVKVRIMESGTIDESNKESITAHGFSIYTQEVKTLSDEAKIMKAEAKAVDLMSGQVLKLHVKGTINAKAGNYSITFFTDKGTELSVKVKVMEKEQITITPEIPEGNTGESDNSGTGNQQTGNSGNNQTGSSGENTDNSGNGNIEQDGITIKPAPNGDKPIKNPDGTITIPPQGSLVIGNNEFVLDNGGTLEKNGTVTIPADGIVRINGKIYQFPHGAVLNSDGTIHIKAGELVIIDGEKIFFKYGGIINADGSYIMYQENTASQTKEKTETETKWSQFILPVWEIIYIGSYLGIVLKHKKGGHM